MDIYNGTFKIARCTFPSACPCITAHILYSLQQVYILFDPQPTEKPLQASDILMLQCLQDEILERRAGKDHFCKLSVIPVFTKVEKLQLHKGSKSLKAMHEAIVKVAPDVEEPILTSARAPTIGIEQMRGRIAMVQELAEGHGLSADGEVGSEDNANKMGQLF